MSSTRVRINTLIKLKKKTQKYKHTIRQIRLVKRIKFAKYTAVYIYTFTNRIISLLSFFKRSMYSIPVESSSRGDTKVGQRRVRIPVFRRREDDHVARKCSWNAVWISMRNVRNWQESFRATWCPENRENGQGENQRPLGKYVQPTFREPLSFAMRELLERNQFWSFQLCMEHGPDTYRLLSESSFRSSPFVRWKNGKNGKREKERKRNFFTKFSKFFSWQIIKIVQKFCRTKF